jgi:hypothetical protein
MAARDLAVVFHVTGRGRHGGSSYSHLTDLAQWVQSSRPSRWSILRWSGPTLCGLWERSPGDPRTHRSGFPLGEVKCKRCIKSAAKEVR